MIPKSLKYLTDPEFLRQYGISQDDANKVLLEVLELMVKTSKELNSK